MKAINNEWKTVKASERHPQTHLTPPWLIPQSFICHPSKTGAVLSPSLQGSAPDTAQPPEHNQIHFSVFFVCFSPLRYKLLKKKAHVYLPSWSRPCKGVSGKEISHSTPIICKLPVCKPPDSTHWATASNSPFPFRTDALAMKWKESYSETSNIPICYQMIQTEPLSLKYSTSAALSPLSLLCAQHGMRSPRAQLQRTEGFDSGLFLLDFSRNLLHWHRAFPLSVLAITWAGRVQLCPNPAPNLSPLIISQLIQQGWVKTFIFL